MASKVAAQAAVPREGTSANPGAILGLKASMLENSAMADKFLERVIPPTDRESVEKLDLDKAILKFFHCVGQVIICFQIKLVLL